MVPVYTTVRQAERVVSAYLSRPDEAVYFDTETSGKRYRTDKLATIQLMQGDRASIIFDVRDRPALVKALAPIFTSKLLFVGHNLKFDLNWLLMYGIRVRRVFDTQIAEQVIYGRGLGDEDRKSNDLPMNLKAVAERRGIAVSKEAREWFYKPGPLHERPEWNEPLPPEIVAYGAQDIEVLKEIAKQQVAELRAKGLMPVFNLEMRALPAMAEMEHVGIHINVDGWRAVIADMEAEVNRLEGEVLAQIGSAILDRRIREYDAAMAEYTGARKGLELFEAGLKQFWEDEGQPEPWGEFKKRKTTHYRENQYIPARPKLEMGMPNLGSTVQLIAGLEALGVPVPTKKNDKGVRVKTTETKALEPMAAQYPMLKPLIELRSTKKLLSNFGEELLEVRDESDRIHYEIRQIGADTGRMSMVRPPFQQIPRRGDWGKKIRGCVTATPGNALLIADFSNIEARVLANVTEDPAILEAFGNGVDLHTATAKKVFGLPDDWDKERTDTEIWKRGYTYRDIGKTINFLLLYGGSAYKMAMELGIPVKEAEKILADYFAAFRGVDGWMKRTKRDVFRSFSSRTLAGRARFFSDPGREPEFYGQTQVEYAAFEERLKAWKKQRHSIEKQALNSPVQGTSADITKLAVALFYDRVTYPSATEQLGWYAQGEGARIVVVVHDEIVVEVGVEGASITAELLADCMKEACDTYLTVSPVPRPKVKVSDHWEKD